MKTYEIRQYEYAGQAETFVFDTHTMPEGSTPQDVLEAYERWTGMDRSTEFVTVTDEDDNVFEFDVRRKVTFERRQ